MREARVDGGEPIPLLEDLLGAWPDVRVNIDPKADGAVDPLVEVIRRTGSVDRVCIGSFSDERIDRLRAALGPRLCTGMGPDELVGLDPGLPGRGRRPSGRRPRRSRRPTPRAGRWPRAELVDAAHRHGIAVHVWTIDDADEMPRCSTSASTGS